jgi:hypothetical protein
MPGIDSLLRSCGDLVLAAGPQFQRDPICCPFAKALADVVAVDDQVLPVVCAAAEEHMDVRIVDVPVIDRHPFQPGAQVAFRVGHQFPTESAKVRHLTRVLGQPREPKAMPISSHRAAKAFVSASSEVASNIRASTPSRVTPSRLR